MDVNVLAYDQAHINECIPRAWQAMDRPDGIHATRSQARASFACVFPSASDGRVPAQCHARRWSVLGCMLRL